MSVRREGYNTLMASCVVPHHQKNSRLMVVPQDLGTKQSVPTQSFRIPAFFTVSRMNTSKTSRDQSRFCPPARGVLYAPTEVVSPSAEVHEIKRRYPLNECLYVLFGAAYSSFPDVIHPIILSCK